MTVYSSIFAIRNDLDHEHANLVNRFKQGELSGDQFALESNDLLDFYEREILLLEDQENLDCEED